jgi:hypothetical protein
MKHEKNTTLGRKHTTGLEKNEGLYKPRTAKNQMGDGADFAFNGQMGDGVNKAGNRFAGNPHGHLVKNSDSINHGMSAAARRGNASDCHTERMEAVGPSATRDPERYTIATASQGHNIEAHDRVPHIVNPDAIYIKKATR